jgi:hypothetical protein
MPAGDDMIPDKTRRKKHTLGVLKRMLAIKARRDGHMQNSLTMSTDIDQKVLWRMRMVDPHDQGYEPEYRDTPGHCRLEQPEQRKVPWVFHLQ